jgi:hypothetical protein
MRGEAESSRSARTQNPAVRWFSMLIRVPRTRRRRTESSPDVHRAASPEPTLRSGGRGRPTLFGYEPFMCAWERPHTKGEHAGGPASARPRRRRA